MATDKRNPVSREHDEAEDVHATRVIPIDEAALARQAQHQRRVDEHWGEVREALDDCREKGARGNCTLSETPGAEFGLVRDF